MWERDLVQWLKQSLEVLVAYDLTTSLDLLFDCFSPFILVSHDWYIKGRGMSSVYIKLKNLLLI